MKRFLILLLFFSVLTCVNSYAQDSIVTSDGQTIRAKILKINWKDVQYKVYEDPEFSTYTLQEKEIKKIKTEKGKKYLFNHNLPRAYFGFAFDFFKPVGSFARTNFDKNEPGFAQAGLGASLQGGFYIFKRLGLQAKFGVANNQLNINGYKKYYADNSDPYEQIFVNYDNYNQRQSKDGWNFGYFTIGPMYSFKPAKWLTVDLRGQFGIMNVRRPEVRIEAVDDTLPSGATPTATNPTSLYTYKYSIQAEKSDTKTMNTYGGGITFRISPIRRLAFIVAADYMHAGGTIHFKESLYSFTYNGTYTAPITRDVNRTYNIDQIRFSLGIAYQFKRKNR
jgi:hypothetical protein